MSGYAKKPKRGARAVVGPPCEVCGSLTILARDSSDEPERYACLFERDEEHQRRAKQAA